MKKYAIIVAAGSGLRMNSNIPKQFLLLQGKPVLWHTIKAFTDSYPDLEIILVLPAGIPRAGEELINEFPAHKIQVTTGGESRFQSVKNGLQYVSEKSIVFVHDGVRCLVTPTLIRQCYDAAVEKGNAIPAIFATDTIRIENGTGNEQIDRNQVRLVQTPQTFVGALLLKGFQQPYTTRFTDEASVVENTGIAINLVPGDETNIKITHSIDLLIAEKILRDRDK